MNLDSTISNQTILRKRSRHADDFSYRQRKAALGLRQLNVWVPVNCYDSLIVLLSDHTLLSKVIGFYYSIQSNPPIVKRNVRSSPNKVFENTVSSEPPAKVSRTINYADFDSKLNLLTEQVNSLNANVATLVSKSTKSFISNVSDTSDDKNIDKNIDKNVESVKAEIGIDTLQNSRASSKNIESGDLSNLYELEFSIVDSYNSIDFSKIPDNTMRAYNISRFLPVSPAVQKRFLSDYRLARFCHYTLVKMASQGEPFPSLRALGRVATVKGYGFVNKKTGKPSLIDKKRIIKVLQTFNIPYFK